MREAGVSVKSSLKTANFTLLARDRTSYPAFVLVKGLDDAKKAYSVSSLPITSVTTFQPS